MHDVRKATLASLGFSGDVNDAYYRYMLSESHLPSNGKWAIEDLEKAALANYGYTTGSLNDRWSVFLTNMGYTGTLNDKFKKFWTSGSGMSSLALDNLTHTVIPRIGAVTPTFTRATTKRIVDSWGRMVTCLAGEVAFPGARRVQNLCSGSSQDNTAGSATTATTTVTATTLTFTAINASYWYRQSTTITNGNTYTCSADISCSVARKVLVRASASGGGAGATNDLSVTSTSQRVSLTFTASAAGVVIFGIDNRAAVGASDTSTSGTVTFTNIQIEDVTGQSVQTAGDYVSVGVQSAPAYHGSCVDGVKCFPVDLSGNPLPTAATFDAVSLNGIAGTYVSTPDSVANSITGDIDIRVKAALVDWTPSVNNVLAAKWGAAGLQSWLLYVNTAGKLVWFMSSDGTASTDNTITSSVATPFLDGAVGWVRVTKSVSTGYVNYYTSSDGVAWTQLGTANLAGSVSAIFDSAMQMEVGSYLTGNAPVAGRIYQAQIYNGINGTLAVDFDASRYSGGGSTLTGSTGETWTLNGNAVIHPTNIPMTTPLIELAATNSVLQSQAIGVTTWAAFTAATTTGNNVVAPDGTTTATKSVEDSAAASARQTSQTTITIAAGESLAMSVYVKRVVGSRHAYLACSDGSNYFRAVFNLDSGTVGNSSTGGTGTYTSGSVEALPNGWYRCIIVGKVGAASTSVNLFVAQMSQATDVTATVYNGDGLSSLAWWGAGFERNVTFASTYIPTTTVAATRNADQLYYTGALIGNLKSVAVRGFKRNAGVSSVGAVVSLSDGTNTLLIENYLGNATQDNFYINNTSVQVSTTTTNAYTPGAKSSVAMSFATNDVKMAKDGVAQTQDTVCTIPAVTRLGYGMDGGSVAQFNGYPGKVYGWTTNLIQAGLNTMTT